MSKTLKNIFLWKPTPWILSNYWQSPFIRTRGVGIRVFHGVVFNRPRVEDQPVGKRDEKMGEVTIVKTEEWNTYMYDTGKGLLIPMVFVPPGDFIMGDDKYGNETPKHIHTIDEGYFVGKFPVTWKEYKFFCDAKKKKYPDAPTWGIHDDHPVVNVNWYDAMEFCEWSGLYLPTEAQWEKAARGTDGRTYPWGEEPPNKDICVFSSSSDGTQSVYSCPGGASPYGAMHMGGNVWEWCVDEYEENAYKIYVEKMKNRTREWAIKQGALGLLPDEVVESILTDVENDEESESRLVVLRGPATE